MQIILSLFVLISALGSTAVATTFDRDLQDVSISPAQVSGIPTYSYAAKEAIQFQEKLLSVASHYSRLNYVPYIWGGGVVGSRDHCLECRACVKKRGFALKNRLQSCRACRRCGIDCSHFVHKIYREAGIPYNYASTWELGRQTKEGLLEHYSMINIGNDLALAQPGDLLIYKRHVVMLSRVISESHADFVHVTRFRWGDRHRLGGIRWDRNRNAKRYRGRLLRILRHKVFFESIKQFAGKTFQPLQDQLTLNIGRE